MALADDPKMIAHLLDRVAREADEIPVAQTHDEDRAPDPEVADGKHSYSFDYALPAATP